jgi:putative ABC transport system permease protein
MQHGPDTMRIVRFAVRLFRASPGPMALAVLATALGVGVNTAIFSVVRAVLLRPLAYVQPDRLVAIQNSNRSSGQLNYPFSMNADFMNWRAQNHVFADMAAGYIWVPAGMIDGVPERLIAEQVSANYFGLLGVRPALGRDFTAQDDQPGRNDVVILSDGFFARRFGRDPAAIGGKILLDNAPYTIIGVMPAGFLPPVVNQRRSAIEVWRPIGHWDPNDRSTRTLQVIGRLAPGISLAAASAEVLAISRRYSRQYPEDAGWQAETSRLDAAIAGDIARPLWVVLSAAGLLLAIACANIANLLLERAATRRQEFAIRVALGGGPARLFRQVLAEGLLLGGCGGALAVLLALWTRSALASGVHAFISSDAEMSLDWLILAFAVALAIVAGLVFGSIPAFQSARVDLGQVLKGDRGALWAPGRLRNSILIAQVAVSFVLLTGAALLFSSFRNIESVELGYRTDHILISDVRLRRGDKETPANLAFMSELLSRVRTLPNVELAAMAEAMPLSGRDEEHPFSIEGREAPRPEDQQTATINLCTPEYFHLMGIRLLRGRLFDQRDGPKAPAVVILNETLARRYFPNENPIGQRVRAVWGEWATVVGVASDIRQKSSTTMPRPEIYYDYAQHPSPRMSLGLRAAGDPANLFAAIRREMAGMQPSIPLSFARTMDEMIADERAPDRLLTMLVAAFAGLAMLLAAVGIYAVISYSVAERTREIGIRIALGAQPRDVVALIVRQAGSVIGIGLVAGMALALSLGNVLGALLYGIAPHDPAIISGTAALLGVVAFAAMLVPALKAARSDPMVAIRCD